MTAASISIPVPQTSPSPCAKWTSPSESSAPGTCTGRSSVEPATSRRMSRLPPVSRGGIVRRPPAALGGEADSGASSATGPPAARIRSSRSRCASISACDGATPITPAWTHAGTAIPGSSGDRATAPSSSHGTRNGSVKTSARKPNPGMTQFTPNAGVSKSTSSTSRTSPGSAPSTKTGPVSGCARPSSKRPQSAWVLARVSWPSRPSRVSSVTTSPGATRATGSRSGCQRLCAPVDGILTAAPRSAPRRGASPRPPRPSMPAALRAGGATGCPRASRRA